MNLGLLKNGEYWANFRSLEQKCVSAIIAETRAEENTRHGETSLVDGREAREAEQTPLYGCSGAETRSFVTKSK